MSKAYAHSSLYINVPKIDFPQYLDEFSKALATEVRMLLGEVGKLREERRNIQQWVDLWLSNLRY
jgi:hypothetical protein